MTLVETCPDCGGDLLPDAILTKLRCPSCEPAAPLCIDGPTDCAGDVNQDYFKGSRTFYGPLRCAIHKAQALRFADQLAALHPLPGWRRLPGTWQWHKFDGASNDSVCGNVWCPPALRLDKPDALPSVVPGGYLSVCPTCERVTP